MTTADNDRVFHFSEDPSIEQFVPHVPKTNPTQPPAVWAIDAQHASLYWFPRDCPRVTAWPRNAGEQPAFRHAFGTSAERVHAMEEAWLDRMRAVRLFQYTFARSQFVPWPEASGQWTSSHVVTPVAVAPVGDLVELHAQANIDLRVVPSLWPLHDLAVSDQWDFSIVRMRNAQPRLT